MRFHVGTILSVMTGRLFTPEMRDIYILLEYMMNERILSYQIPQTIKKCQPFLQEQFPQLKDISENINEDNWQELIRKAIAEYGEYFEIEPLKIKDIELGTEQEALWLKVLNKCENLHGAIRPQTKEKIIRFLSEPTTENWDNIAGIIIKRTGMKSIKEAMRAYDPTFPDGGRVRDAKGNIVKDWERIPTPSELLKAIEEYTKNKEQELAR